MLIGVAHQKTDGATGRLTLEDAAEQFYLIVFLAGCREVALTRLAASQFTLDKEHIDFDASRHTINDTAYGRAVTLTEGGEAEKGS